MNEFMRINEINEWISEWEPKKILKLSRVGLSLSV